MQKRFLLSNWRWSRERKKRIITKSPHKLGANSTLIWKDRSHATKSSATIPKSGIHYWWFDLKFWRSPKRRGKIKLKAVLEVFRPAESVSGLSFVSKKLVAEIWLMRALAVRDCRFHKVCCKPLIQLFFFPHTTALYQVLLDHYAYYEHFWSLYQVWIPKIDSFCHENCWPLYLDSPVTNSIPPIPISWPYSCLSLTLSPNHDLLLALVPSKLIITEWPSWSIHLKLMQWYRITHGLGG